MTEESKALTIPQVAVTSVAEAATLGGILAKSGFFSDVKEGAQAVVKILAGQELGIPPLAAMRGISIVQGKVNLDAGLLASLIQKSGHYAYRVKTLTDKVAELVFFENGQEVGTSKFTIEDAQNAGLLAKGGPWRQYPRNMLFARALSNGQRWYCPALAFGSVYTGDELESGMAPNIVVQESTPAEKEPAQTAEFTESKAEPKPEPKPAVTENGRPVNPQFTTRPQFMDAVAKWLPRYRSASNPTEANDFAVMAHLKKDHILSWADPKAWASLCAANDAGAPPKEKPKAEPEPEQATLEQPPFDEADAVDPEVRYGSSDS